MLFKFKSLFEFKFWSKYKFVKIKFRTTKKKGMIQVNALNGPSLGVDSCMRSTYVLPPDHIDPNQTSHTLCVVLGWPI
jgi:hypothetical protein